MVDHSALSIEATDSRTRVHTVLVDTGQGGDTVRVDHALRSAARVGITKVLWSTAADALITTDSGVSIGSTWIRIAGISWWWRS